MKLRTAMFTLSLLLAFPCLLVAGNDIFLGDLPASDAGALVEDSAETISTAEQESRLETRQARLNAIQADIIDQRAVISKLYADIGAEQDALELRRLEASLATATQQLERLQKSFEDIAIGGVDTASLSDTSLSEDAGIESGMRDIFKPLVITLRRITERPRKVEQLRGEIEFYQSRMPQINMALSNLAELEATGLSPELKAGVDVMKERWRRQKMLYTHRLQAAQLQLDEQFSDDTTLAGNIGSASLEFLTGRGFNLFLAVIAFALTMVVIVLLRRLLMGVIGERKGGARFYERLLLLIFNVLSILLAFIVAIGVLYVQGDWLILGLVILFLFGIGWSLKNMLPSLMDEARLVLNMGVVREGERVLFQGMPWKVDNIGIYSTLVNPLLTGGTTRITLGQLRTLNARPLDNSEAWFPTNQGDFVLLSDDRFGQVTSQSPEAVQLRIPGRSICYLRTPDFLAGNPVNLSENGFGLYIHCDLDHQHRYQVAPSIRTVLEKQVRSALEREEFGVHLRRLQVGFRGAERYALGLGVFAAFSGEAAPQYIQIRRALREIIFDTCNDNGWSLAYSELKINTDKGLE